MIKPLAPAAEPGIVLIGFACDLGVVRDGGRAGARDGPHAVRTALADMAWYQQAPVYDWGDVRCDDDDMTAAQLRLSKVVEQLVSDGHRPLVVGGGCEASWGTYQGIVAARPRNVVGVVNIDAHLDLSADPKPNSGTTFAQIEEYCRERNRLYKYFAIGLANSPIQVGNQTPKQNGGNIHKHKRLIISIAAIEKDARNGTFATAITERNTAGPIYRVTTGT